MTRTGASSTARLAVIAGSAAVTVDAITKRALVPTGARPVSTSSDRRPPAFTAYHAPATVTQDEVVTFRGVDADGKAVLWLAFTQSRMATGTPSIAFDLH